MRSLKSRENLLHAAGVTSAAEQAMRKIVLEENKQKLLGYISDHVIGSHKTTTVNTVYGLKPHVYLDFTATGKNLVFLEDYIKDAILPLYANTHNMQSHSGKHSLMMRHEARSLIKEFMRATEDDALVFCGTGATSASNLLIAKLHLADICRQVKLRKQLTKRFGEAEADAILDGDEPEINYCKQNRWKSFDCTLCKVILPS
jgi:hypothetical protein